MPSRFTAQRGAPTREPGELVKRIDRIAAAASELAKMQLYVQAAEPQIGDSKGVLWVDTSASPNRAFLVIRVRGVQYKIELTPSTTTSGSPQGELSFKWVDPIDAANHQFFPGGVDVGMGSPSTIIGFEGRFEIGPNPSPGAGLVVHVLNGAGDGAPQVITIPRVAPATPVRFSFSFTKAITAGNLMLLNISGSSVNAEGLLWARLLYTIP